MIDHISLSRRRRRRRERGVNDERNQLPDRSCLLERRTSTYVIIHLHTEIYDGETSFVRELHDGLVDDSVLRIDLKISLEYFSVAAGVSSNEYKTERSTTNKEPKTRLNLVFE